jgi:hypothetical protein
VGGDDASDLDGVVAGLLQYNGDGYADGLLNDNAGRMERYGDRFVGQLRCLARMEGIRSYGSWVAIYRLERAKKLILISYSFVIYAS